MPTFEHWRETLDTNRVMGLLVGPQTTRLSWVWARIIFHDLLSCFLRHAAFLKSLPLRCLRFSLICTIMDNLRTTD